MDSIYQFIATHREIVFPGVLGLLLAIMWQRSLKYIHYPFIIGSTLITGYFIYAYNPFSIPTNSHYTEYLTLPILMFWSKILFISVLTFALIRFCRLFFRKST